MYCSVLGMPRIKTNHYETQLLRGKYYVRRALASRSLTSNFKHYILHHTVVQYKATYTIGTFSRSSVPNAYGTVVRTYTYK